MHTELVQLHFNADKAIIGSPLMREVHRSGHVHSAFFVGGKRMRNA